jgi:hypothetical protein
MRALHKYSQKNVYTHVLFKYVIKLIFADGFSVQNGFNANEAA